MIFCYICFEMVVIWLDQNKYKIWYLIEVYVMEKLVELGVVFQFVVDVVWKVKDVDFDVDWINEIEVEVKYDVIVFLMYLVEYVGEESWFVYQGLILFDVLDICLVVQMKQFVDLLLVVMDCVFVVLKICVEEYKYIVCIGCLYGIYVELIMMGLKFVCFYVEFVCNWVCFVVVCDEIFICVIFGVIGMFVNVDLFVEVYVVEQMGLIVELVFIQVILCDCYVNYFVVLGLIVLVIENIVVEVCYFQCFEVCEVQEYFFKGQKGLFVMLYKCNLILMENLIGQVCLVCLAVILVMENVVLWYECDILYFFVECGIGLDVNVYFDFVLYWIVGMIEKLIVYEDCCCENLEVYGGIYNFQCVLFVFIQVGVFCEDSYCLVQCNGMKIWDEGGKLVEYFKVDEGVIVLFFDEQIEVCFDEVYYFKYVDMIFVCVLFSKFV